MVPTTKPPIFLGSSSKGAMPLWITTSLFLIPGQETSRREASETQIVLCERRMVNQWRNLMRHFSSHERQDSLKAQPCPVKMIFFTPTKRAARFPSPPIFEELVWKTSGCSSWSLLTIKRKERISSRKEISLF